MLYSTEMLDICPFTTVLDRQKAELTETLTNSTALLTACRQAWSLRQGMRAHREHPDVAPLCPTAQVVHSHGHGAGRGANR